jgi:Tol biopolymer transport system component
VVVVDPGKQSLHFGIEGPVSVSSTGKLLCSGGEIHSINGDGTGLNRVVPRRDDNEQLYSAAWSPDGQTFAVLSMRRDTTKILSVAVLLFPAAGGTADTVVSLAASGKTEWSGDNSYSLCWSPDGLQIAFTRPDRQDIGSHIYVIKKDHSGLTQVTFAPGVTDRSLSWSK